MTQPKIAIAITGDDKTDKAARSAEKRLGLIPKHVSASNRAWARDTQATVSRTTAGITRSFGEVERATAKALGGSSFTSGITGRLGAVKTAATGVGEGMASAAEAGGMLQASMIGLGAVAGATVAVLGAAAYGAFRLADGWAKGAASVGRLADTMGVARKEMQEFAAASERVGVDKGAATGNLASLSQTLNDARYGRNRDALAALMKMGVKLQLNPDGTVATEKMLPAIADAIAAQTSSGRRTAVHALGMSDEMVSVFAQGGKALAGDMADAANTAYVASDADIARGKRIQRKGAMVGQLKDRALAIAGSAAADAAEPGYDAVLEGGRQVLGGATTFGGVVRNTFAPAAHSVERGGKAIERAADTIGRVAGSVGAGISAGVIGAAQAATRRHPSIPASVTIAQYALESGYGRHMPPGSNNPFGIKARAGEPYVLARTREEDKYGRSYYIMAKFRKFASIDEAFEAHAQLLEARRYAAARGAGSAEGFADALTGVYATEHNYGSELKRIMRARGLEQYDRGATPIPVKVEIDMRGAPHGTRATVRAGGGPRPAISHSFQPLQPVHGG